MVKDATDFWLLGRQGTKGKGEEGAEGEVGEAIGAL